MKYLINGSDESNLAVHALARGLVRGEGRGIYSRLADRTISSNRTLFVTQPNKIKNKAKATPSVAIILPAGTVVPPRDD